MLAWVAAFGCQCAPIIGWHHTLTLAALTLDPIPNPHDHFCGPDPMSSS